MKVLSLFNGMSVCSMALEDVGIKVDEMYISEIDKHANKASEFLFGEPLSFIDWCKAYRYSDVDDDCGVINTGELESMREDGYDDYVSRFKPQVQLGSVLDWREWDIDWSSIDLVTGGFPCQAWSMAGKQLGDRDDRGMLFWTMLDIMKQARHHNPKTDFLIENVRMKKEFEEYITTHTESALGEVHKTLINSALVSAQNRNRYYWTSFAVSQPDDEVRLLSDILETNASLNYRPCKSREFDENSLCHHSATATDIKGNESIKRVYSKTGKSPTLTTMGGGHREPKVLVDKSNYRKLTPRECMRLQTIPERYIDKLIDSGISNTQLNKMTGNAWTMKVISHILSLMIKRNG